MPVPNDPPTVAHPYIPLGAKKILFCPNTDHLYATPVSYHENQLPTPND